MVFVRAKFFRFIRADWVAPVTSAGHDDSAVCVESEDCCSPSQRKISVPPADLWYESRIHRQWRNAYFRQKFLGLQQVVIKDRKKSSARAVRWLAFDRKTMRRRA